MKISNVEVFDRENLEIYVDTIFGNAHEEKEEWDGLVEMGVYLSDAWQVPDEVLLIGYCESGMHEWIVLNYELEEFLVHSVLYFDDEGEGEFILIADTFEEFISKLQP